jgi:PAS domain S-box-containing protein
VKLKYDSYEVEIIVSLGFLLLFLLSINFISGFSFERARLVQEELFEKNLSLAADYAATIIEHDMARMEQSKSLTVDRLHMLSLRLGVDKIALVDDAGRTTAATYDISSVRPDPEELIVERSISDNKGNSIGRVRLRMGNRTGARLAELSRWDAIFRILGLMASLFVAALFLKAVLLPYRRIKREALDFNLDVSEPGQKPGIEYVVSTLKNLLLELEEKRERLERLYHLSERRADSLARYNEHILGSITSGVIICDSKGIVTRLNPSAQAILQYLERDCRGKHYREIFGAESKLSGLFDDALLRRQTHSRIEFDIGRLGAGRLWLGCSSSLLNDERGEGVGVVVLLIDMTEIRRLQEQASYSEKMVALGETAAGLAHEVRNSFAAIIGFARLAGKLGGDRQVAKLITSIKDESVAAENLMSRFLSFARPLYLNLEDVAIKDIIETAIASLGHPRTDAMQISKHIAYDLPTIKGDGPLLRQAVSNLLINACDALPDGGEIAIRAYIEAAGAKGEDSIVISVADNGIGIEPEIAARIFEPFVSGKPDGTGLGLALVKKIVVLHGGRIEVHSKPGKGTRFTIVLPVQPVAIVS